jgi:uncharacterized membrane protein/protein-disulfide isomerase
MAPSAEKHKKIKALPFFVYFWVVFLIAFTGLIASVYLAFSHYRVYADIGYSSFCAISRAINCDTISQSKYSIFLGLPVSVWGIIGYTFFLMFLPFASVVQANKRRIWSLLLVLSFLFSLYSLVLAFISTYYIRAYCLMCIVTYVVNLLLLYFAWIIRRRFPDVNIIGAFKNDFKYMWTKKKQAIPVFSLFFVFIVGLHLFMPHYWEFSPPPLRAEIPQGTTEDGHPWIGAENPQLIIIEYTDYLCFQCKKMHFYLRQLVAQHPDKIRIVHYHYPMDNEYNPTIVPEAFHVGSGKLSLLAIYAATQGKFWKMNDVLFDISRERDRIEIKELAEKVGLNYWSLSRSLNDKRILRKLQLDIWSGMKLRVIGTPTYLIEGELYPGHIPPEIIRQALK